MGNEEAEDSGVHLPTEKKKKGRLVHFNFNSNFSVVLKRISMSSASQMEKEKTMQFFPSTPARSMLAPVQTLYFTDRQ